MKSLHRQFQVHACAGLEGEGWPKVEAREPRGWMPSRRFVLPGELLGELGSSSFSGGETSFISEMT